MNGIKQFFDLYSSDRDTKSITLAGDTPSDSIAGWRQAALYFAATLGVFLGPFVSRLVKEDNPTIPEVLGSPMNIISSLFFGAVVLAVIFKTKAIGAKTPFVIQMGLAGLAGLASGTVVPMAIEQAGKLLLP